MRDALNAQCDVNPSAISWVNHEGGVSSRAAPIDVNLRAAVSLRRADHASRGGTRLERPPEANLFEVVVGIVERSERRVQSPK